MNNKKEQTIDTLDGMNECQSNYGERKNPKILWHKIQIL